MRDIKFRGKRVDNGEWVYGDLVHLTTKGGVKGTLIIHDTQVIGEPTSDGAVLSYDCNEVSVVISATVGQFTGRIDKNGKDIYEGGILIEPGIFDLPRTVFWDHRFMRFGNIAPSTCGYIALHDYSKPEVIGNIHDNPELLSNDEHDPGTSVN